MTVILQDIRVDEPLECGALAVFPVFTGTQSLCDYVLAHEAIALGTTSAMEISEEGSVCELLVSNDGNNPVLFPEGMELCGGRQNRMASRSVLVAARSRAVIPVTCVERYRWEYSSRRFATGSHCPPSLRRCLMAGAMDSTDDAGSGKHEQTNMWAEIRRRHHLLRIPMRTGSLSDLHEAYRSRIDELRTSLPYLEGASGIAVACGGEAVIADIFNSAETCRKLWDRVSEGAALDALELLEDRRHVSAAELSARLYRLVQLAWQKTEQPIGVGERYIARGGDGALAAALVVDGAPVHVSVAFSE